MHQKQTFLPRWMHYKPSVIYFTNLKIILSKVWMFNLICVNEGSQGLGSCSDKDRVYAATQERTQWVLRDAERYPARAWLPPADLRFAKARAEKLSFWEYRIYTDSFLYHHYVNQGKEFHAVVLAKHNMAKSCYTKREACRQPATTTGGMLSTEAGFTQVMKAWKEYWNSTGRRGTRRAVQTSRRLGGFSVLQPVSI